MRGRIQYTTNKWYAVVIDDGGFNLQNFSNKQEAEQDAVSKAIINRGKKVYLLESLKVFEHRLDVYEAETK